MGVTEFLADIPWDQIIIQTVNGVVTGMILALIASGLTLIFGIMDAALQVTTLRPLLGRDPLTTILATFGISLVLQNYALWQFGPVARKIQEPFTGHFTLFYLEYPWYRLGIAGVSAALLGGVWLFLQYRT